MNLRNKILIIISFLAISNFCYSQSISGKSVLEPDLDSIASLGKVYGLNIYDTFLRKSIFLADEFEVEVIRISDSTFTLDLYSWNPIFNANKLFGSFELIVRNNGYKLSVLPETFFNYSNEIRNADSTLKENVEVWGYINLVMFMRTFDRSYFSQFIHALEDAEANTNLIWYPTLLYHIGLITSHRWNDTGIRIIDFPILVDRKYK